MSGPIGSSQWMYSSGSASFFSHTIDQSLRFNNDDQPGLRITFGSDGTSQALGTFSWWMKRCTFGASQENIYFEGSGYGGIQLRSDKLAVNSFDSSNTQVIVQTDAVLRDPSAWYHCVVSVNGTAGTIKFYINGTEQAQTVTNGSLASSRSWDFLSHDSRRTFDIGDSSGSQAPDAYLAEFHYIDGQAYDASYFGETKDGVWVPKAYSGSHGTNGFHLPFDDSSAIGDDESANTNDFTPSNLAASDVVPDTPTNNFCTWNTLDKYLYNAPTEGSLRALTAGNNGTQNSTFAVSSGKWYWEARNQSAHSGTMVRLIGIAKENTNLNTTPYNNSDCYLYYGGDGNKYNGGSQGSYGDAFGSDGDIVGVAFDADNGAIWFSKNGTWQNSATASEIAAGTTTNAAFTGISGTYVMMVSKTGGTSSNDGHHANFGQDSTFAGQITAGGNSDSQGIGDFKYAPPSGFLALCTSNLPDPTIGPGQTSQADDHFNTVLWTGNNSASRGITGVGFQPDFVWTKSRNSASYHHQLHDSVRGASAGALYSSLTNAEDSSYPISSFDSDGFTTSSGSQNGQNTSHTYVGWFWKAGGSASSNSDGSIASSVSVNTDAGFSIVSFDTDGNTSGTVGHGLGVQPQLIFGKTRNHGVGWYIQTPLLATNLVGQFNTNYWYNPGYNHYNDTHPTDSVFSVGGYMADHADLTNPSTKIAYCFHSVEGYSKVGSYEGNSSSTDGPFIFTGFRPAWVMGKNADASGRWWIYDNKRTTFNDDGVENGRRLQANAATDESTSDSSNKVLFFSNGFKVNTSNSEWNTGNTYIYLAFAEAPFKFANAR